MALAAAASPLAEASPVGRTGLDLLWAAGLAAGAAYLGSTAKRGPLLAAALVAVLGSRSVLAVLLAIAAVLLGFLSTKKLRRRAFFARGASAGAAMVSLLASAPSLSWWVSPFVIAGVAGPIVVSGIRHVEPRLRAVLVAGAGLFAVFLVAASGLAGVGAQRAASSVDAGSAALRAGLAAARQGDTAAAAASLDVAQGHLISARDSVRRWGALGRVVPVTAQHVDALDGVLGSTEQAAEQAARVAVLVDNGELAVSGGRVNLDAVEQLQTPLRNLAVQLGEVVDELERSADRPLLPLVKDRLQELEEPVGQSLDEARSAANAAAAVPELLGADGPKRYLVLFTSPAEARGRFGFPGSFAEVTLDNGRFALGEHGTTSAVFANLHPRQGPFDTRDPQIAPYVSYGPTQTLLSVTIPPDFPTVARLAAEMWAQSGRDPVDGVLRFDPASLAPLVALTGPIQVPGVPEVLTAENVERFLVFDQYVQFASSTAARREVLDTVSEVTFRRLQTANLPEPRILVDLFTPALDGGHLNLASFDELGGAFLDSADLSGRFEPPPVDGLMVTNVNVTGNKIDTFLRKAIQYDARVEDGRLDGTVTVVLENTAPASGLPPYVIGSFTDPPLPPGTNRTTLVVYTSVPATEIRVDGDPGRGRSDPTGGRYVHQVVVELAPGESRVVELRLNGDLADEPYELRLEAGNGAVGDEYDVAVQLGGGQSVTFRGRVTTATALGQ